MWLVYLAQRDPQVHQGHKDPDQPHQGHPAVQGLLDLQAPPVLQVLQELPVRQVRLVLRARSETQDQQDRRELTQRSPDRWDRQELIQQFLGQQALPVYQVLLIM